MSRPKQARIHRDEVVRTALSIVDEQGLGAFGVESLARRLGVKGPSLYHHFSGRDEILAGVARLIVVETPLPPERLKKEWQSWLIELATNFRRSILAHPNAAPLVLKYFPRGVARAAYERSALVLADGGVPAELHSLVIGGLDKFTFGSALFAAGSGVQPTSAIFPAIDRRREPALFRADEASLWRSEESLFRAALEFFLAGIDEYRVPQVAGNGDDR